MSYWSLLEQDDQATLALVWLLESAPGNAMLVTDVMTQLSLSRYKLNKSVEESQKIFNEMPELIDWQIELKHGLVGLQNATFAGFRILQLHLLKRNMTYKILFFEYFVRRHGDRRHFFDNAHISQARYYALRSQIQTEFHTQDAFQNLVGVSVHPEFAKRADLTSFCYYYFSGIESPFPELEEVSSHFLNFLAMTLKLSLTPSQRLKLKLFFQVQVQRIHGFHDLNTRSSVQLENNQTTGFIVNFYNHYVPNIENTDVSSEVTYLYLFLLSQKMIDDVPLKLEAKLTKRLNLAVQESQKYLNQTPIINHQRLSMADADHVIDQLLTIGNWLAFFNMTTTPEQYELNIDRLAQSFPGIVNLARELCEIAQRTSQLKLPADSVPKIVYNFVVLLIDLLPTDVIEDQVTVCIDFGQSNVPVNYIEDLLQLHILGGVHVTHSLTAATDIYLSDTVVNDLNQAIQITWPNPLQTNDWSALNDVVNQLKQQKIAKLQVISE